MTSALYIRSRRMRVVNYERIYKLTALRGLTANIFNLVITHAHARAGGYVIGAGFHIPYFLE